MVNMIDNITEPAKVAQQGVGQISNVAQELNQNFSNMAKSGIVMAGVGRQITNAALAPVGAVFETKKALGELASVGIEDLKALEEEALNFSSTWAGTTKAEFITAAYDIKSGISSLTDEAVAEFTTIAGITAKGTKSSIAEMTNLFATGYGIYKSYYSELSDIEFGEMFSAGIAKSVQQFKTDGSKMAQSIQTLGASATTSNVPLEEQLSILGMLQATMGGAEAGTKYKAFLQSAAKAGETLKLKFTDANDQLLSMPEILAQLKGKFGETMDAAEKMELQKAFGTAEAVALIDLLYGKTDELESNILGMYDSMSQGTLIAEEMANAINQTEGEKFEVLKQKIQNTIETIGNGMLPTVNKWLDKGAVILEQVSDWIMNHQELAGTIGIVTAVIGVLLMTIGGAITIIGSLGSVFVKVSQGVLKFKDLMMKIPSAFETLRIRALYAGDAIKGGWSKIKSASSTVISSVGKVTNKIFTMGKAAAISGFNSLKSMTLGLLGMAKQAVITAATAMPGLIASVWSFTTALLANPITWIVIAIVALVAAIILLWQNWDAVSAWLSNTWNGIVQGLIDAWNWLRGILEETPTWLLVVLSAFLPFLGIPLLIIQNWESIKEFFSSLWTGIVDGFNNFFTNFLPNLFESGKKIIDTLCEGIMSVIMKPVEIVRGGFAKLRELLPFSDAKEGPLSDLTLSGSRIFTTIGEGMQSTMDVPADLTDEAFKSVSAGLGIDEEGSRYRIDGAKIFGKDEEQAEEGSSKGQVVNKNYFNLQVDIRKIKDLGLLLQLAEELKDSMNKNSDEFEDDFEEVNLVIS